MSFFCPRIQSRILHCILLVCSLSLLQTMTVPQAFLSSMTLTRLMSIGSHMVECLPIWLLWYFLIIRLHLCIWGKNTSEVILCSQCFISEGTWCQYILLWVVLILITWLSWYLPDSKVTVFFSFVSLNILRWLLWGKNSVSPQTFILWFYHPSVDLACNNYYCWTHLIEVVYFLHSFYAH